MTTFLCILGWCFGTGLAMVIIDHLLYSKVDIDAFPVILIGCLLFWPVLVSYGMCLYLKKAIFE